MPGSSPVGAILDVEDLLAVADRVARGVEGHGPRPPQHLDGDAVDLARHRLGRRHGAGAAVDRLAEVDLGRPTCRAGGNGGAVVDEERVAGAGVGELEVALLAAQHERGRGAQPLALVERRRSHETFTRRPTMSASALKPADPHVAP